MSTTKLTVGIPTFNRAGYLRETIESVLAQTFADFRLIVSDNASEDDTADVVRSFGDDRIRYVRSDHNLGAIANLNRLIALADTEYLVLVPDDDLLYPDLLGAALSVLERYPTVAAVHSAFNEIDAQGRIIRRVHPVTSRSPVTIESRDRALERLMSSRWGMCFPSIVYRTKVIAEKGGFGEDDGVFGDRKLWMRMALDWDFAYLADPLVGFRTHAAAITTNVGVPGGTRLGERERVLHFSEIHFQRRMEFLEEAALGAQRTSVLLALASLQRLVESAGMGLGGIRVAAQLGGIVRSCPQIVLRTAFWRLVAAQVGGRRVRDLLRRASSHPRLARATRGGSRVLQVRR